MLRDKVYPKKNLAEALVVMTTDVHKITPLVIKTTTK